MENISKELDLIKEGIWKGADGKAFKMSEMSEEHLQKAFSRCCSQEFQAFNRQNMFDSLRNKIQEIAKQRGIKLSYPDERFPSPKWGNFFEAMRRNE